MGTLALTLPKFPSRGGPNGTKFENRRMSSSTTRKRVSTGLAMLTRFPCSLTRLRVVLDFRLIPDSFGSSRIATDGRHSCR